ncbi:MAG: Channel-forming transporter/cytolysins activator of TpsB family [Betaproteobacteria bacterium]|nr:Channel-forming transporter/cytolysins activator of TpsB family [Betaproteobacteria bacterium]
MARAGDLWKAVSNYPWKPGPCRAIAYLLRSTLAATALSVAGICGAAEAPLPAGTLELLRQQERERELRQQLEQRPDVRLTPPVTDELERLPENESPCFVFHEVELTGEAAEKFQWALAAANPPADPALERCLGAGGINLTLKRVQNAVIARGFITTRVLAQPQDVASGTLTLTLVPGRIRAIRFAEDADARATRWNAVPPRPGDLLNLRDIEQALENFKRVPTAEADIQILPAEGADAQPGQSDLVIRWKQAFPIRFSVFADNAGTKATGKYQGGVTVAYDHWWTLNDLFYASYLQDLGGSHDDGRGTRGYTVHYSLPFGYWLLGFTTNSYNYHQSVAGVNQTFIFRGEVENHDVRLSRLVYRDAVRKTTVSARAWLRESSNFIEDVEVQAQHRRMAGWELGLGHREFIRTATLDLNLAYRRGTGAFNALPAPEEGTGEGTSRLRLYTYDAQFNVPFTLGGQRLRYTVTARAQLNRTPLVPQDRFAIGGRYTVRGFDGENVLLAERGWLIRNDLGFGLPLPGAEFYVGADYGEVGGPSSRALAGTRLAGAVAGLRAGYKGFYVDVFVGTPLYKPEGFRTASTTAGFSLNWSF